MERQAGNYHVKYKKGGKLNTCGGWGIVTWMPGSALVPRGWSVWHSCAKLQDEDWDEICEERILNPDERKRGPYPFKDWVANNVVNTNGLTPDQLSKLYTNYLTTFPYGPCN